MSWESPHRKHLDFDPTYLSDFDCIEEQPDTRFWLQYQAIYGLENSLPPDLSREQLQQMMNMRRREIYFAVRDEEEFHKWGVPSHLKLPKHRCIPVTLRRKRMMFQFRVHGVLIASVMDGDHAIDLPHADMRDDEDLPDWQDEQREDILQDIPKEVLRLDHTIVSCFDEVRAHIQELLLNYAKWKHASGSFSYICSPVTPEQIDFYEEQGFEVVPDAFPYGYEGEKYWVAYPREHWNARWRPAV